MFKRVDLRRFSDGCKRRDAIAFQADLEAAIDKASSYGLTYREMFVVLFHVQSELSNELLASSKAEAVE